VLFTLSLSHSLDQRKAPSNQPGCLTLYTLEDGATPTPRSDCRDNGALVDLII